MIMLLILIRNSLEFIEIIFILFLWIIFIFLIINSTDITSTTLMIIPFILSIVLIKNKIYYLEKLLELPMYCFGENYLLINSLNFIIHLELVIVSLLLLVQIFYQIT